MNSKVTVTKKPLQREMFSCISANLIQEPTELQDPPDFVAYSCTTSL